MLLFRIIRDQTVTGVSVKTQQLFALVFFFRCISIFLYEGYKPYDKSGGK